MTTRNSRYRNVYAQLELRLLKEDERLPDSADDLPHVMQRWGLGNQPQECTWVIACDSMLNLRTVVEVGRGTHISADIHMPSLLAAVLTAGAERFILVHNHPNGSLQPTVADFQLTLAVTEAANACHLYFEDHLIITPRNGTYSFVDSGFLKPAPYVQDGQNVIAQASDWKSR
jgi:DNA repair protein RadC